MSRLFKIILIAIVGTFFSLATLEIDVFGFDNTFFDTYDLYVQADNPVSPQFNQVDLGNIILPRTSLIVPFTTVIGSRYQVSSLLACRYKRKLYIAQSTLLI
jgi:hypothetical protein